MILWSARRYKKAGDHGSEPNLSFSQKIIYFTNFTRDFIRDLHGVFEIL